MGSAENTNRAISDLVAGDLANMDAVLDPGSAISNLRRKTGAGYLCAVRPLQFIRHLMEIDPDLIPSTLSERQLVPVRIMILASLIASSLTTGPAHVLDGRRLLLSWTDLPEAARKAIFSDATDRAVRRLAEIATPEAEIAVTVPSKLAQALITDGQLTRRLNNGGLSHD